MAGPNRLRRSWLLSNSRRLPRPLGGSVLEIGAALRRGSGARCPALLPLPIFPPAGLFHGRSSWLPIRNRGYFRGVPGPRAPSSHTPIQNNFLSFKAGAGGRSGPPDGTAAVP